MQYNFGKRPLFILELANNFNGNVCTGLKIIGEMYNVSKIYRDKFDIAIKFQLRTLDTFIHPKYKSDFSFKYIKRFMETRLNDDDFFSLKIFAEKMGFITICTAFDEQAVSKIIENDYDIIKVASCSATDWPLLNRVVEVEKPIIISTAGVSLDDLDKVVAFFEHRNKNFAIVFCVGQYPTYSNDMQLNQIDLLKSRYPNVCAGLSTHEEPEENDSIKIAIAKGAKIFEKHVAVDNFNSYSASPKQVAVWLRNASNTFERCGVVDERYIPSEKELEDLSGLKRGVYVKEDINIGERITREKVYYCIPNFKGQVLANSMSKYANIVAKKKISKDDSVMFEDVDYSNIRDKAYEIIEKVKKILKSENVHLPNKLDFTISHHKGIENFYDCGAVLIDVINREYCKKIIVLLSGQTHPVHYHKIKEESFHILKGDLIVFDGEGEEKNYITGDIVLMERNKRHGFKSKEGCVFEEISTSHYSDDSYYMDESIVNNKFRKTEMTLRDM